MSDVTLPTLAEMERCATILSSRMRQQHRTAGEIMERALLERSQMGAAASQLGTLGLVPVSPHISRITALEADVARLLAENVRLAAANAVLQRGAEIIAAADVPPATRPAFPARALARQHQAIGMTCGI